MIVFNPEVAIIVCVATGARSWASGQPASVGSNGLYWSATPYSAANGYRLYFYSGYVNPQTNATRANGYATRCVAEFLQTRT